MSEDELKCLLEGLLSEEEAPPPEQQLLQVPEPGAPEGAPLGADLEAAYRAGQGIARARDVDQVLAAVLEYTHQLDLDRCLIALIDELDAPAAERGVQVRAVWDRNGQEAMFLGNRFTAVEIPIIAEMGAADQVLVEDFATSEDVDKRTRATFQHLGVGAAAILPLAVGGQLLGWLLAEAVGRARSFARQEIEALQSISNQAAVALQNLGLLTETRARAVQLEAAAEISSAASSILKLDELLTRAVELIGERFGLYYVGIFLRKGDEAVLRAGTGEAGRQMMEENYRLPVGEGSMIGRCVASGQARIALDVGKDAVRFDNPLLPETRSEMALPLNSRGRVVGAMTIHSTVPAAFGQEDVAVLQIMADQLGNAIENARLFQERERRITELAIVNEIGASLATALRLDELFELVHRQVSRLFNADNFYIAIYEEGSKWWTSAFHLEQGQRQPRARYSIDAGLTGHIIRTRQPVLFGSREENARFQKEHGVEVLGDLARSWLGVPLVVAEKLVGVMAIQDYTQEHLYGESDVALFATIGAQVAGTLDNVRLLEETRRRAQEMEVINEVGRTIASVLDLDEVLRQIVDVTKERFGHYFVNIALLEGERLVLRQGSTIGDSGRRLGAEGAGPASTGPIVDLAQSQSLIAEAARSGKPVLVSDVADDPRYLLIEELPDTCAELAVPIELKGAVIGTLDVQSDAPFAYNQTDVALLQALANQAGVAIENARLFGESRHRADEFAVLHQTSLELTQEQRDLDSVLAAASRRIMELLDSDGGGVWLWQEREQELELVLNYQVDDAARAYSGKRLKPGEGLTGRAFSEGQIQVVDDYLAWNGMAPSFDDAPFAAALAVPMIWRAQPVGVLVATRSQPDRPYLANEQNLAELLAAQAAAVIQNARLFEDARARAEQLALVNEVGQAVVSVLDLDAVLRQIVDTIKERLGYFFVGIMLLEGEHLVFRSGSLLGDSDTRWVRGEMRMDLDGEGLTVAVVKHGESILVNDVSQDPRYSTAEGLEPVRSELDTPIWVKGQVIGVLTVQSDRLDAFAQSDRELLEALANQAGVAIENAQLFAETENALGEMEALYNTSRLLASARDLQEVLAAVAEGMYVAAINRAILWEAEETGSTDLSPREHSAQVSSTRGGRAVALRVAANWYSGEGTAPLPVDTHFSMDAFPAVRLLLSPAELFVEDVKKDGRLEQAAREYLEAQDIRALAILPLWIGRRQIGVLMLAAEKPHHFSPREMRPYRSLAGQMAVVIENRQLFEQAEAQLSSLTTIQAALAQINAAFTFEEAIDALLPQVADIGGVDRVRMYLLDGARMTCVGVHTSTGSDAVLVGDTVSLDDYPLTKKVVETGEPMSILADDPRLQPYAREEYDAAGLAANATIPLIGREGVVGVLSLNRNRPAQAFSEQDVSLIQTLANQATTVLEKNQLFEEMQQRTAELQSLYETSLRMSSHLETAELLGFIVEQAVTLLGAETAGFYLYEPSSNDLVFSVAVGYFTDFVGQRLKPDEGLAGRVFQERRAITVEDYQAWSGRAAVYEEEERLGMLLAVPLLSRDAVLGVLDIAAGGDKIAFEDRDLWLAELFAAQAATALENVRLFEESQIRAEELVVLNEMGRTLTSRLDVDEALRNIYRYLSRLMDTTNFYVALYDPDVDEISFPFVREGDQEIRWAPRRSGNGLTEYVMRTAEPLLIQEDVAGHIETRLEGVDQIGQGAESWLGVPLLILDQVLGIIAVQSYDTPHLYAERHRDLLMAAASQAAIAIQNARLFKQTQARARYERILREVTARVRASTDTDVIMRTAVQELGTALGRPTFIRLGAADEAAAFESGLVPAAGGQNPAKEPSPGSSPPERSQSGGHAVLEGGE